MDFLKKSFLNIFHFNTSLFSEFFIWGLPTWLLFFENLVFEVWGVIFVCLKFLEMLFLIISVLILVCFLILIFDVSLHDFLILKTLWVFLDNFWVYEILKKTFLIIFNFNTSLFSDIFIWYHLAWLFYFFNIWFWV